MMASRNPSKFVPSSAYTYAVTLRARHPSVDPAILTTTLKLDPAHSWKAGDPRLSQAGAPLGGQHRDSYWSAPLPSQMVGATSVPLETFILAQLLQLARHRDFLGALQADGGEISLLIEIAPLANTVLTLSSTLSRRLADLNIEVEFQFPGD
jgi:Domain of unknown function (DUF4279)